MTKPNWLPLNLFFLPLVICLLVTAAPAVAQDANPQDDSQAQLASSQLTQLITHGKQLEVQGRWGEALSHYQQALKRLPENPQIKTRRSIARIHFNLNRRYSDAGYVRSIATIDGPSALNMYSEILLKIQSYYVHQPDWDNILRHGLACMEIALSDQNFLDHNLPGIKKAQIQPAVDEMNSVLNNYSIRTRQDAFVIASNICRMMQRRLGLSVQSASHEFCVGAVIALDPYSSFMTSNQYGETMSQIEGNFVGLGVELKTRPDHLEIVNVIPSGPAGRAGIVGGDSIVQIDGQDIRRMGSEKAADALRGVEGSFVNLTVENANGKPRQLRLQRKRVDIPSVEQVRIVDQKEGVGYIKLTNFQKTTARDFDAALWRLQQKGMRSLIVDVRGNPGGLLNASVEIADRFVESGVIVSTRGRNPLEDYVHRARAAGTWRVPLVVLIDGDSASASEIFAAAINDHQRGIVVGQQSYGKGSVQGIFPLNVGRGGVRLTTAKFYSPKGVAISHRGVHPGVAVQSVAKPSLALDDSSDETLRIGIQVARRGNAQRSAGRN